MAQRKVSCEIYTDRGIVGESAYEQAVAGGYTGTKQEFEQLLAYDLTTIADGIDDVVENLPAIQAASENADKAQKWAEGTDAQVTPLGGVHSSKGWANVAKGYADSIDLTNYRTAAAQDTIDATKQPKTLSAAITVNGQSQTTVEGALNAINENSSIANTSLSNVTGTSGLRKLVETYQNGTSWYKVFAEYNPTTGEFIGNWCEQGGLAYAGVQVQFTKEFADTNYSISGIPDGGSDAQSATTISCYYKATTSIYFTTANNTTNVIWEAKGYIS